MAGQNCKGWLLCQKIKYKEKRRTYDVVESHAPPLEYDLHGEATDEREPELDEEQTEVLVEGVEDHLGQSAVVPGAVNEEKSVEKAELWESIVRRARCLQALHTVQADANVRHLQPGKIKLKSKRTEYKCMNGTRPL